MKTQIIFQKKLGVLLAVCVGLLILLPVAFGEVQTLGTFKQYECITLKQTCANCTYINITSIFNPNSTQVLTQIQMTKSGTEFNYSNFCNTSEIGKYIVNGKGDIDGIDTIWAYDFYITQSGSDLTTAQGIVYLIALALAFVFFIMSLYFSITIPFKNRRNDDGKVISINQIKYVKIFTILLTYVLLLFIFGISYQITKNFLYLSGVSELFNWLYWILLSGTYPAIVLIFIFTIIIFIEDLTTKKKIKRWHLG